MPESQIYASEKTNGATTSPVATVSHPDTMQGFVVAGFNLPQREAG